VMEKINYSAAIIMLAVFAAALWPRRKRGLHAAPVVEKLHQTTESAEAMMEKMTLLVQGMSCNGCVNSVKRVLGALPGVDAVEVDLASGKAEITGENIALDAAIAAIERLGFAAQPAA